MKEEMLNLDGLTEEERDRILSVLRRDDELKSAQGSRVSQIESEINEIRMNGVLKPGEDGNKLCRRCRTPFGYFFNTGEFCPQCKCRVCKNCREFTLGGIWSCILCYKQRQLKALTGEWLAPSEPENNKSEDDSLLSAPELVRKSIRSKSSHSSDEDDNGDVKGGRNKNVLPLAADSESSTDSSGREELVSPKDGDRHRLNSLLVTKGLNQHSRASPEQPVDTVENKHVKKVSNKRYVDSDSSSSDAEDYVVITTPPKSVAAQARSLPSSTSGFSTGRDSSGNSDHEDGNGSVYHASSARTGQRLHFDESSYRPHSELPSIDDLLAKSKAQHSPLSSMTSSPTPSTIGERLIDLAASAENSDAEADLQHDSDVDHDVFELEEEDIADGTSLQHEYEVINEPPFDNEPIYIEYHDVSDASDALSIISENTEPSDDNYESEDDFERVFRKAEADEVSLKGSVKETAETDLDSIIDEMSQQGDAYLKEDMRRIDQDFDGSDAESGSTIVDMDQPGAQLKRNVLEEQSLEDIEVHSNTTLNINSFVDEMNFFCAPTQSHSFDIEEGSSEDSESEPVVVETPVPKKAPEKPAVNNPIVVTKAKQVKSEPVMKKDIEQEKTVARNDQGVKSANSQSRKVLLKNQKKSVSLDVPQKSKAIVPRVEMEAESDYSMSTDVSLDENHIDVKSFEDEMSFFCAPVRSPSFETLGNEADIDSQQKPDGKVNMEVLKSHSQTLDTAQHREENHLAGNHITDKTEAKIAQSNKKVTMKRSLSHDSKHKDKEITTKPDKEALKEKLSDIIPMENDTQVSCTQVKPIREDMRTEPETIVGIKDDSELQRKSSKQKQDETSVTVKEGSASKSEQVTSEPAIKKYNEPEKEDQISVQIVNSGNSHSRKVLLKNNPERSASLDVPEKSMTNDHPKERQAELNHSPSMDVSSDENQVNGKTFEEEMSFFCAPQSTGDNEEGSEPLQRKSVEQKQEEFYVKETKPVKEQLPELSVEEEKLIQKLLSDLDVEIDESAENSAENSGNVDNTDEDSNIEHEEASKVSKNVDLESDLAGLEAEFVVKSEHGVEVKPMSQKQEVSNEEGSDESQTIQSTGSVKKTESEINSTEKDLASEPTTQEKSDSTDGGRLLETDAVETASSKEVETSVADTSEASDLSSSTADTDVLEDGSTNGSKKSQLQEGTVSGGRENISVTEKVDKSSEVNKIETTEKIETKETTSKVIDTAILDSGDKSKEKIDALREEPNSLKENKSVLSNISEDETHIESEDKAEQEVAAVLEIAPDVHSEVRSEIVEDVRSEIKNDVRSEVVEDVSVQRQKEGEIKSVAEDQKEVELRDQEGDDPVKLTKGEDPSVLSTKTKIESNQSVKKDSDTIESEEIKEKCVEESDLKVKVQSNDIDINQPEKNVIQHQNSDMIKVKSVKMADNESTSSGQGDKNDLALVSANVSETSSEFSETVKSEENNNEIKSSVDSDNSLKVKDKKPKKSSLKKDTKFKQTVQSDTYVEVKEKKIKKSSVNRELEVKASSDVGENVNMSKKTTLKVESAEKLSSINEENLEQQSMNDEATRRKILFKDDTPGGTNSQNLKPRKQKKKAVQFQDTDKENVIKTLAAGTVKNLVNGPAKTDGEGLSKWDQGVLANSTPKQKIGDETEPKKPPRKTGKAVKDNANSKTAARMITSDSWDDDTSVKPMPDEEKSQANSARLVTSASLVASEQTDASSIQGDSGNLTGTSQDGTASSPSHSKSPSQVSVPSIQVSSADGEAEEDHIEELDTSLRSHSSTFQQTFGGLFSSLGGSRESIASYYSQAGGYTYGLVEVKGAIQFAVDYKYKVGVLEIIVKQASELAAVDTKKQRSDPYVKTYLLPDRTRNGKRKTQRRKNDLNPVFNETLRYHVSKSGLGTRTLWLTVWHHDRLGKNVFLGEVTVPLTYFSFSSLPQWYTLQDREEMDESVMTYKGDLIVSLKYIPLENLEDSVDETGKKKKKKHKEGQLCVLIKEAKNLAAVRSNGYSDPFCKGYLLPDKGKHVKQKTMVVKQNLSPKWNFLFTFEDVSFEELPDRAMELTVWDHDRFSSNDFLGGARLNLGTGVCKEKEVDWMDATGEEVHIWQSMINNPNAWVDATLTLRPSMDKQQ